MPESLRARQKGETAAERTRPACQGHAHLGWRLTPRARGASSETRTTEPRGSPSAVGEVELLHRRARAVPPSRERELQRDAGRPHAPHGTHQAAVPQSSNCPRERPSLIAEGGLRGDKPLSVRSQYDAEG